jgi:pSer/pThr/pTyr-binding forkhead associated (FHA) protein
MRVVLVMFKDGQRREFPLRGTRTVLGRAHDCDLRIPTRDVSRRHCEIEISSAAAIVRDLGSSNGTYVNGRRVAEATLNPGDRLTVGPVVFVLQIDGKPAEIRPADAAVPRSAAKPRAPVGTPEEDTEEVLDLEELDLELDAELSGFDEDEDEPKPPGKKK